MIGLWQDLRYGARTLRLNRGFAVVAIFSLALGMGANAANFQLLDAVRLRSLPVQNSQKLVEVRIVGGNRGLGIVDGQYTELTRPIWEEIRDHQVTGDFFRVLGVQPWQGRLLQPQDKTACPGTRAVVSYAYWQRELGGRKLDSNSALLINGDRKQIIGVTPRGFFGLAVGESFDIATPICREPKELRRDVFDVAVVGRLRPDWSLERASAHFNALSPGIFSATALSGYSARTIETYKQLRLRAHPVALGVSVLRDKYDSSLYLLFGITGQVDPAITLRHE